MQPAIFLDKDGTVVVDVPYNVDPSLLRLAPRAAEGLRRLAKHFRLFIVSNQSGIAHGKFTERSLAIVERRLRDMLAEIGAPLAGFYYCPHHPEGEVTAYRQRCDCRKPQPGLLARAAAEHGIDTAQSWMIGDILDDVEAGRRAGCRTVLIDNGGETEWQLSDLRRPHHTVPDLAVAAGVVLAARDKARVLGQSAKAVVR
jgi:D-glycero-D-manno-heptose 1,7-bisphosphate phosphatase